MLNVNQLLLGEDVRFNVSCLSMVLAAKERGDRKIGVSKIYSHPKDAWTVYSTL